MADKSRITGIAEITVDGQRLATENGATLDPGGYNREPERHGGDTYYKEEEVSPSLECNVLHTSETDILALSAITGATVIFKANTGQRYMLRGAFATATVPLDSGSGKSALKLSARSCDKI
jgi:Phage tail tube protein